MSVFHRTASVHRPGAHTMPAAEYYTSPAILAEETERPSPSGTASAGPAGWRGGATSS
ncbi:MAG: hypothetical protein R2909_10310 [Gemmatimonadales bacterium]